MGFIIIGLVLAFLAAFVSVIVDERQSRKSEDVYSTIPVSIFVALVLAGLIAGLFTNTGGYHPVEAVQTVALENLADYTTAAGGGDTFYVSINAGQTFSYYAAVSPIDETSGSRTYKPMSVSGDNVLISEESGCENPHMTTYRQNGISTFWSFAINDTKTSYVFYVPEGTVAHDFKLDND